MKRIAIIIILLFILTAVLAVTVSPTLLSFNTGAVSPLMEARVDFPKYRSACRTVENMLVTVHGSAQRRPGTMYVADANTVTSNTIRIVPFTISTDDSYIIEFSENALRVFRDSGL